MKKVEFERLALRVLDGEASDQEVARLESAILDSEDCRRLYRDIFIFDAALSREAEEVGANHFPEPVVPVGRLLHRQRRREFTIALAVAAVLLLCTGVALYLTVVRQRPVLAVRAAPNSVWRTLAPDGSVADAQNLKAGDTILVEGGTLELSFREGVTGIVQGPAQLLLDSHGHLNMAYGSGRFRVEEAAKGFTVRSPRLAVRDLGTEFGIVCPESDRIHPEVHVFNGRVEARATRGAAGSVELLAGKAMRVTGVGRMEPIPLNPNRFFQELPDDLPHLHLTFEPAGARGVEVLGNHPAVATISSRIEGDVVSVPGINGKGLAFQSPDSRLVTSWTGTLGDAPRTVMAWIRLPENAADQMFQTIVGWGDPTIGFAGKTELLCFQPKPGGPTCMRLSFDQFLFTGTTDLADGKWHHLAAVYNSSLTDMRERVKLYVDGRPEELDPATTHVTDYPLTPNTREGRFPLVVGDLPSEDFPDQMRTFAGTIDEVWVFEAALKEGRIAELAKKPGGR